MIANWCEEKKIKLPDPPECPIFVSIPSQAQNLSHVDDLQCNSCGGNSILGSSVEVRHDSEKKAGGFDGFCDEELHVCQVGNA